MFSAPQETIRHTEYRVSSSVHIKQRLFYRFTRAYSLKCWLENMLNSYNKTENNGDTTLLETTFTL